MMRNVGKGKTSKREEAEDTFTQKAEEETVSVHSRLVHSGRAGWGVGWRWHRWQERFN